MPTITKVYQTYEGKSVQCAKLEFTEQGTYKFNQIVNKADDYQFQMVVKADGNKSLTVQVGDTAKLLSVTSSFARYTMAYAGVTIASSDSLYITFPTGTYWLYNLQLERASTPSGWRPAPEDADDAAAEAERLANLHSDAALSAYDAAMDQQEVFDRLTGGGQVQGIYLDDGKVYINASYIASGTISANFISGGTINANDVSIINLIADHLVSYGNSNQWKLESQASYLDIRELVNSVWKQRVGTFISSSGGAIRLSDGEVDANGNLLAGSSSRTIADPYNVWIGRDENGDNNGTLYAKAASLSGNLSAAGNVSATGNGTFKYINADTIGSEKASTTLDTVNGTWSFSITGCRFICIEGQAGSLEIQTTVIPCAAINNYTYGWRLATGTTAFTVSRNGSTCTVTLTTASNSTCRLLRCYSIV